MQYVFISPCNLSNLSVIIKLIMVLGGLSYLQNPLHKQKAVRYAALP